MNTITSLAGTATASFSTDQTAYSVNRFIARRPALISRPETNEQRRPAGAPVPQHILYPSLYAENSSLVRRCGDCFRAIVTLGDQHAHTSRTRPDSFAPSNNNPHAVAPP